MGYNAMYAVSGGSNTVIGENAAGSSVPGYTFEGNTLLGYFAGYNLTGARNTLLGWKAGGATLTTGNDNIIIGYNQDTLTAGANNFLNIGGVIYGDLSGGSIGIGVPGPQAKLHVNGNMRVNGDVALGDGTETGNKPLTVWLKNSGAFAPQGAIVAAFGNNSFSMVSGASTPTVIGVAYDVAGIAAGSVGRVAIAGVTLVKTPAAGVNAGEHVVTSINQGEAAGVNIPVTNGTSIGVWLETTTGGVLTRALLR